MNKEPNNIVTIVVAVVFVAFGIGMFFVANILGDETKIFYGEPIETTATITRIETDWHANNKTEYTAYISYEADGIIHEAELDYYITGLNVGDEVVIYYDSHNPSEFTSESRGKMSNIVYIIAGIFFIVIGINMIIKTVRKMAKN